MELPARRPVLRGDACFVSVKESLYELTTELLGQPEYPWLPQLLQHVFLSRILVMARQEHWAEALKLLSCSRNLTGAFGCTTSPVSRMGM